MARYKYQGVAKDGNGKVIQSATVAVYEAGTTTAADVYTANSGGSAVNSVSGDASGFFYFWVDTADYARTQQFKIVVSKTRFINSTYDDLVIFPISIEQIGDYNNNLETAIAAIGSDETTLLINDTVDDLTANATIPSTLSIDWQQGVTLGGAYTLTLGKAPIAGNYQLFESDLTVDYSESTTVYANWYAGASLAHQINNALAATVRLVVRVHPQSTAYTWTTLVELTDIDELHFDLIEQSIAFEGSSGGGSGASDIAIRLDRKSKLFGGIFTSSRSAWDLSNHWTCIRVGASANEDGGKNRIENTKVVGFEKGLSIISGSARGIFYSYFGFREFVNCYYSVYLEGTDLDINSNTFDIRHISVDSVYSAAGDGNEIGIYLKENGGAVGHNIFMAPIIESTGAGAARTAVKLEGAIYNSFYGVRHEGWYYDFVTINGANDSPVHNYVYGSNDSPRVSLVSQLSLQFLGTEWPGVGDTGDERSRSAENYVAYYPKIMTATTVTIGAAGNFADLKDAINVYRGCILEADLIFQLLEDITVSSPILISDFISAGGIFKIDLNSFTITSSVAQTIYFVDCQGLNAKVYGSGTMTSSKNGSGTVLIIAQRMGYLDVSDINFAYTGDNTGYGISFIGTNGRLNNIETDDTNPVDYTYKAVGGSHIGEDSATEAGGTGTRDLNEGSMAIRNTGVIYTEAGSVTPS